MKLTLLKRAALLMLLSTLNYQPATFAQGTSFTYQGRLNDGSSPATGNYDLTFTLFGVSSGGSAIAGPLTNSPTDVSNGLFTVTLDFGNSFPGAGRWLEIAVRTNGGGSYANLVPRQKITATPYAITAGNLSGSISASQLSGAIPLAQLPPTVVTNGASGVNISGTFNGNGGSLSNLNSENLAGPLTVAADPVSLGHIDDGGAAFGVAVSGNFAYLANHGDGLRVYNIANPINPVSIGYIDDGGIARGVAVSGNFAYLANDFDGLRVYNIANPTNPVSIGHIDDGGAARGVAVSGNFAYLANDTDGLRVYNIANPTNPVSIGHIDDGGNANGVAVSGNFAYLANYDDGLRVYGLGEVASAPFFRGDGSLLTGLNAYNITSGTIAEARLSANVALRAGGNTFTGNQIITSGSVGIGTAAPGRALQVGDAAILGSQGMIRLSSRTPTGNNVARTWDVGVPETGDDASGTGYSFVIKDTLQGSATNTTPEFMIKYVTGYVGLGTNVPSEKLHVIGNILASGTITPNSDRNAKTEFEPVDTAAILQRVAALPIQRWRFNAEEPGVKHVGPMAQDFHAAFGLGAVPTAIATVDADGVALAAIQGLNEKVEAGSQQLETRSRKLEDRLHQKETEIMELRQTVTELKELVQTMNHKLNGGAK